MPRPLNGTGNSMSGTAVATSAGAGPTSSLIVNPSSTGSSSLSSPSSSASPSSSTTSSSNSATNLIATPSRLDKIKPELNSPKPPPTNSSNATLPTPGKRPASAQIGQASAKNNQLNTSTSSSNNDDTDEVKVYNDEGAADEEQRNSENLTEEKTEIVKENLEVGLFSY